MLLLPLIIPLASAAIIAIFLRKHGNLAAFVSVTAAAAVAILATVMLYIPQGDPSFFASVGWDPILSYQGNFSFEWLRIGNFSINIGVQHDYLAALMLMIVGVVGFCVHFFSLGYMADDRAKARYFGGLSIFMFSMIGIVLADNLFMIFIFWELVGFSSWLLINHYDYRQSAADASKKAFIVNRIGDFGFLIGIVLAYHTFGTVNLGEMAGLASGKAISACIPLLLFCGAVGKSAQLPLQVWLPDAMEGPTPVSALIHAATMVAAGIYMLCRIEILMVPEALQVIMWIGTATALYAAICAIVQTDIKKILAYSTLSQLGYMVAAFGLGVLVSQNERLAMSTGPHIFLEAGTAAAMFHLTTHAFFKALLFLSSGAIIHACHHEQDIFKMGGLAKKMPVTFITMSTGVLAIIGMPGLSGFFSKDAILYLSYANNPAVFAILAFTAILTALYMVRMWKLVFLSSPRSEASAHAQEVGSTMSLPLVFLAILALFGGYTALYPRTLSAIWLYIPEAHNSTSHIVILATSLGVMLLGACAALFFYKSSGQDTLQQKAPALFNGITWLQTSFDRFYAFVIRRITDPFARLLNLIDQILIAGVIVRGTAGIVAFFGITARFLHNGNLRTALTFFMIGVAILYYYATR